MALKQMLSEKPERTLLFGCLGLMVVFAGCGIRGAMSSQNPEIHVVELKKETDRVSSAFSAAKPAQDDLPPEMKASLIVVDPVVLKGKDYQPVALFEGGNPAERKRRPPEILSVEEAVADVARVPLRSCIFNSDFTSVLVLEDAAAGGTGGEPGMALPTLSAFRPTGTGGGGRGKGGNAPGVPGGYSPDGKIKDGSPESEEKKAFKYRWMTKTQYDNQKGGSVRPGEEVLPARMVVIGGSFPYRDQLEEFRRKLRLPSLAAVLAEDVKSPDGGAVPAFRFLGVQIQRRELKPSGNWTEWADVDIEKTYEPFVVYANEREEPEDERVLNDVSFDGLVMPRLLSFREKQYPYVEGQLAKLQQTIKAINDKNKPKIAETKPRFKPSEGYNPFVKRNAGTRVSGGNYPWASGDPGIGDDGKGGSRPGGIDDDGKGRPRPGGIGTGQLPGQPLDPNQQIADYQPPDYCLVRVVDVTVEPGKTYNYRLKVRMGNPNYGLPPKEVATTAYTEKEELVNEDNWFVVGKDGKPQDVVVPPEILCYAVDQKKLEKDTTYKGVNTRDAENSRQVILQVHKWMDAVQPKEQSTKYPVGDWIVAERVPVFRGEYIGRFFKAEVPVFKTQYDSFGLLTSSKEPPRGKEKETSIEVDFGPTRPTEINLVLADFEGPDHYYERLVTRKTPDDKVETRVQPIRDPNRTTELMLVTPDGKLLVRDSVADATDAERVSRLETHRKHVKEAKEASKPADKKPGAPGTPGSPFGPGDRN